MHDVALKDNPQRREALYKALLKSTLMFPGTADGSQTSRASRQIATTNTRVNLHVVKDAQGRSIVPVFTSALTYTNWSKRPDGWVSMPAQALFRCISEGKLDEVRINPFPPNGKMLKPGGKLILPELIALGKGWIPQLDTYQERIFDMQSPTSQFEKISPPSKPLPGKVYFLIEEALRTQESVKAAFHFDMDVSSSDRQGVVGFQLYREPTKDLTRAIMQSVAKKLKEYDDPRFGLDMFVIQAKHLSKIAAAVKPFYERASE